ncbi:hypothetical protein B0J14DRAFT_554948 [Halenospora varia]|nr:hypothetical protein B0J14DRAFT_554948 [Halenospora varia]
MEDEEVGQFSGHLFLGFNAWMVRQKERGNQSKDKEQNDNTSTEDQISSRPLTAFPQNDFLWKFPLATEEDENASLKPFFASKNGSLDLAFFVQLVYARQLTVSMAFLGVESNTAVLEGEGFVVWVELTLFRNELEINTRYMSEDGSYGITAKEHYVFINAYLFLRDWTSCMPPVPVSDYAELVFNGTTLPEVHPRQPAMEGNMPHYHHTADSDSLIHQH